MRVAIEPRKATDRGGYYCMPLKVNVPTSGTGQDSHSCEDHGMAKRLAAVRILSTTFRKENWNAIA